MRVKTLGEELVAFRERSAKMGILEERCSHRGASLAVGPVEECGIRCICYGWFFDAHGRIPETPDMAEGSRFKDRNPQFTGTPVGPIVPRRPRIIATAPVR